MSKRKPKSEHKKSGRPTVMTEIVIGKLEQAFSRGASDRIACAFAGINMDTLYDYCKKNPKFSERKESLKHNPAILALNNVFSSLHGGDKDMSKWYLERKLKDEFSLRQETTGADGQPIQIVSNIPMTFAEKKKDE